MVFTDELRSFANSMAVDQDIGEALRNIVHQYITETLGFREYHVMLDGKTVFNEPGLDTASTGQNPWCNDKAGSVPVLTNKGTVCATQSTYAYKNHMPLWITARDKRSDEVVTLNEAASSEEFVYLNEWTGYPELGPDFPVFANPNKSWVKTSITVPMKHGASSSEDEGHIFGFISLHSDDYRTCTDEAKRLYKKLARAIGAVLSSFENNQKRMNSARMALKSLEEKARHETDPLQPPTVFFAYAKNADHSVVNLIRKVVGKFYPHLHLKIWERDPSIGNIALHLVGMIANCQYGICYLSEPEREGIKTSWVYNDNVLIEAGMFQALVNDSTALPKGWIPIREEDSPPPPFDFLQERHLNVQRISPENQVDEAKLRDELTSMLEGMTHITPKNM